MGKWEIKDVLIGVLLLENAILIGIVMWLCINYSGGFYQGSNATYQELLGTAKEVSKNLKVKDVYK